MAELSARVRFASEAKPLPKMWIGFLLGIIFLAVEIIDGVRSLNSERETIFPFSRFAGIAVWLYWLYCVFKFHDAVGRIFSLLPADFVGAADEHGVSKGNVMNSGKPTSHDFFSWPPQSSGLCSGPHWGPCF
ncbi:MAG: hypothetical protein H6Q57_2425 [Geobacteraceae bacterium]|nr:hypothetical protein [Geobacteraceae bacterium]